MPIGASKDELEVIVKYVVFENIQVVNFMFERFHRSFCTRNKALARYIDR